MTGCNLNCSDFDYVREEQFGADRSELLALSKWPAWKNSSFSKTTNNKIPQSQQNWDPKVPPDGAIHCNHHSTMLDGNKKSQPVTASEIWSSLQFCWENPNALSLGWTGLCCCFSSSLELTLPLPALGTKAPNWKLKYLPIQKILSYRNNQKCLFTLQNGSEFCRLCRKPGLGWSCVASLSFPSHIKQHEAKGK